MNPNARVGSSLPDLVASFDVCHSEQREESPREAHRGANRSLVGFAGGFFGLRPLNEGGGIPPIGK